MTITAYPFDNQDTTESDYSRLFRELQDSGVVDSFGGTGFAVSANSAGMQAAVQPGVAILRGHMVVSTAVETVAFGASTSQGRTDRVVLRLNPATNAITLAVVPGTPGAGLPALTQTDTGIFELPLSRVTVDPGVASIAADKPQDDRRFVGGRVGVWTTGTRPTSPRRGRLGLNTTTGLWEYWTGTAWSDLAPNVDWSSIAGKPNSFPPSGHTHTVAEISDLPSTFTPSAHTHTWSQVTGKPSSFPPDGHTHSGADISTGKISIGRLPVGSGLNDVAIGNHTHDTSHVHPDYLVHGSTIHRANGSSRVHTNTPEGNGWYAVWVDGNRNSAATPARSGSRRTSATTPSSRPQSSRSSPAGTTAARPPMMRARLRLAAATSTG